MFRIKQRIYNWLSLIISAAILQACGGGGDPSVPDNIADLGLTQASVQITSVPTTIIQGENQTNTVSVLLTDQSGTPLNNEIVSLTTTLGIVDGSGSTTTSEAGVATFNLTLTDAASGDSGVISASYENTEFNISASDSENITAGAQLNNFAMTLQVIDPSTLTETTTLTPDTGNNIVVTLLNNGSPASGQVIQVTATGVGVLSSSSAITDNDGVAQVTLDSSGLNSDLAGIISASHSSSDASASTTVTTGAESVVINTAIQVGDGSSVIIPQDVTTEVLVTLTDGNGDGISGEIVTLSSTTGTITGNTTALTDSDGEASFEIFLTGETPNNAFTLEASYSIEGVDDSETLNVSVGTGVASATYDLAIEALSLTSDGKLNSFDGNTIQVTLSSANGGSVDSQIISLDSASFGTLANTTILTNSSGVATTVLFSSGIQEDTPGTLTATFGAVSAPLVVQAGPEVSLELTVSGASSTLPELSQSASNVFIATLTDPLGMPIENALIEFVPDTFGTISGNGVAITNSDGDAEFSVTVANQTAGTIGSFTATFNDSDRGISGISDTINAEAGEESDTDAGALFRVTVEVKNSSDASVTTLDPVSGNTVEVTLFDDEDNRVSNALISLLNSNIGNLGSTSILTNGSGVATTTLNSSDLAPGIAGSIIAEYTKDNISYTGQTNVQAGESVTITLSIAGSTDTPPILSQSAVNTVNVELKDADDTGLANRIVVLTPPSYGTIIGSSSAATDSNGIATFSLNVSSATEGDADTLTASYTDGGLGLAANTSITVVAGEASTSGTEGDFSASVTLNDATDGFILTPATGNTVTIQLLDSEGIEQPNEVIELETTLDGTSITPTSVLTNADGNATATIDSSEAAEGEAGTIEVRYEGVVVGTLNFEVGENTSSTVATGDVSMTVTVDDGDGNPLVDSLPISLNTVDGNSITIHLQNADKTENITSAIVRVESDIGTIEPSTNLVLTNSTGEAFATINSENLTDSIGAAGTITVSYTDDSKGIYAEETVNVQVGETSASAGDDRQLVARLYEASGYLSETPPTSATLSTADEISQINEIQSAIFEIRMTINGEADPGQIINVTPPTVGDISPNSGQIVTNDHGIATIQLSKGSAESGEADSISAVSLTGERSNTIVFSIGSSNLELGLAEIDVISGDVDAFHEATLEIDDNSLTAGSSTGVSVYIVNTANDEQELYTSALEVLFTSECVALGLAEIDESVFSSDGLATATYTATGCTSDTITATLAGIDGPSASGSLTVDDTNPSSIEFTSAEPEQIFLKGSGGVDTSLLTYTVKDNTGEPEANVTVSFELTTGAGGVRLSTTSGITNNDGEVSVIIEAGNIPTPVRVRASITVGSDTFSTVSDQLTVNTGLPDQRSFSISASNLNPGGGDYDGAETTITVRAADAFNNPVPVGTTINFTTEFGSIDSSCAVAEENDGSCEVTWRSQNPRSQIQFTADQLDSDICEKNKHYDTGSGSFIELTTVELPCLSDDFAEVNGSKNRILAYAVGEESFSDANANGLYDDGELHDDTFEAFIDHNDNGTFDNIGGTCDQTDVNVDCSGREETFVDYNNNGSWDDVDGVYNGTLCNSDNATVCTTDLINVYDALNIRMSSSYAYMSLYNADSELVTGTLDLEEAKDSSDTNIVNAANAMEAIGYTNNFSIDVTNSLGKELILYIADINNGPLPSGAEVSVDMLSSGCQLLAGSTYTFSESSSGYGRLELTLADNDNNVQSGPIIVTAVANGIESSFSFNCTDD